MYKKTAKGWLKHLDFMLVDILCLQIALIIAYMIRHGNISSVNPSWSTTAVIMLLVSFVVVFFEDTYKGILKRGPYKELVSVIKFIVTVVLGTVFLFYMLHQGSVQSRMVTIITGVVFCPLSFCARLLWKQILKRMNVGVRSILVVTTSDMAQDVLSTLKVNNYERFRIAGIVLADWNSMVTDRVDRIPVVADRDSVLEYLCRNYIDEVFLDLPKDGVYGETYQTIMTTCMDMGLTVHEKIDKTANMYSQQQVVERIAGYTVLTSSINIVNTRQLFAKRALDILGGLVGCFVTLLLILFIGPAIYIKSPGPIFFSQIRVGRNGKRFKLYKFRSMYLDAEERKKELMEQNDVKDGMMFKMKDDPRIIKGVGHFIRKTSLDEFPQFFNVLKGDMSLVGTRPPTVDEWEKYEAHHRKRLAFKPGITGLWQVSGRSNITDFEDVVALDTQYIAEWSFSMDIKILLKTVKVVLTNEGAS